MDTTFKEMMIKHREINTSEANGIKPLLSDVAETEWIRHARTLDFEEVLDCYANEIEDITDVHDKSRLIRNQLKCLLKVYVNIT